MNNDIIVTEVRQTLIVVNRELKCSAEHLWMDSAKNSFHVHHKENSEVLLQNFNGKLNFAISKRYIHCHFFNFKCYHSNSRATVHRSRKEGQISWQNISS